MTKVMNVTPMMVTLNLVSKDASGRPLSLILAPRETSRDMKSMEMESVEVTKALASKIIVRIS